jgi:RNA polymerase sigma-70 factor (ECF subfamily)
MKYVVLAELSERELVEGCVEKKRRYQEQLYYRYGTDMYQVCLMYAKNEADASDILQESFIKVFKNIHTFQFKGPLGAWIRRTVVFTAINAYKKKQRETKLVVSMPESGYADFSVNELAEDLDPNEIVKLVNQLPKRAQQVLKLYAIEGYKHQEIADMLDISVGTSKSQINRAKKLLQKAVKAIHG